MSILSDRDLLRAIREGRLKVTGLTGDEKPGGAVQPASIDLRLGADLIGFPRERTGDLIDPEDPPEMEPRGWSYDEALGGEYYALQYGEMVLGATEERVAVGRDVVAIVEGRSTLGRLGLFVHITAGFVDPGWGGWGPGPVGPGAPITLELLNMGPGPLLLRPGMPIAQLAVLSASTTATLAYGHRRLRSKYADSDGPVGARAERSNPISYSVSCSAPVGGSPMLGCTDPGCLVHGGALRGNGGASAFEIESARQMREYERGPRAEPWIQA